MHPYYPVVYSDFDIIYLCVTMHFFIKSLKNNYKSKTICELIQNRNTEQNIQSLLYNEVSFKQHRDIFRPFRMIYHLSSESLILLREQRH